MKKNIILLFLAILIPAILVQGQTRETRSVDKFTKIAFRFPGKVYLRQGSTQKVELEGKKDILNEVETKVEGSRLIIGKEGKWFDFKLDDDDKITVYITVPELEGVSVSGSGDVVGESKFNVDDLDLNVSGSGSLKMEVNAKGDVEADVSGSGDIDLKGTCNRFESDVSGSGKVALDMAIANNADFSVSGSGRIEAAGTASDVSTSISGSGKVLGANLQANRCEVRISGSGDVEINVKNELDATISGSGTVTYKGNPNKVHSNASGSGKVRKM